MRDPSTHSVHTASLGTSERTGIFGEQSAPRVQQRTRTTQALGRSPLGEAQWQSPSLPALFGMPPQSYATPATSAAHTVRRAGISPTASDFSAEYAPTVPTLPTYPPHVLASGWPPPAALPLFDAAAGDAAGAAGLADRHHHAWWRHASYGGRGPLRGDPREPPIWPPALDSPDLAAGCSWQRRDGRCAFRLLACHTTSASWSHHTQGIGLCRGRLCAAVAGARDAPAAAIDLGG